MQHLERLGAADKQTCQLMSNVARRCIDPGKTACMKAAAAEQRFKNVFLIFHPLLHLYYET